MSNYGQQGEHPFSVFVIEPDPAGGYAVIARLPIGQVPIDVAVNEATNRVYVSNPYAGVDDPRHRRQHQHAADRSGDQGTVPVRIHRYPPRSAARSWSTADLSARGRLGWPRSPSRSPSLAGPSLGAEAQPAVRAACDRIAAIEAGDGAKATQLWTSVRTGTTTGVEELTAVWVRMTDAYTDVDFDIPVELNEIREFRTAVFVVGGTKDIAADFLKSEGVAKVESYFAQADVRKAEQTVRSYCA